MKQLLSILLVTFILITIVPVYAQCMKVTAIDAGDQYSMALTNDGNVWMWGKNVWIWGFHQEGRAYGQLGNSSFTMNESLIPIQSNVINVKAISAGYGVVSVLKNDGTVWSWGPTSGGQMGNGNQAEYNNYTIQSGTAYTSTPIKADISNVTQISVGTSFIDALKNDGTVWSWGDGWRMGLSTNYSFYIWSPIQVKGLSNIKEVKAGLEHSVALDNEGRVWIWGENISNGEKIINGSDNEATDLISTPIQVSISDVKVVTAGRDFSLALKNDGTVWGWGEDTFGELGDGISWGGFTSPWSYTTRPTPVMAQGLTDVVAIDSYDELSLALKKDGTVWEWGRETSNKILTTPTQVPIDNVVAIACGTGHLLVLKSDGSIWSWGDNQFGKLGTGTKDDSSMPVRVLLDNIQTSGRTTTDQPDNQSGNTSGTSGASNVMISPALIMALVALLIIACGIVYFVKKDR
jgi:alpha-tubulin suppressor-like RCC1 family protein